MFFKEKATKKNNEPQLQNCTTLDFFSYSPQADESRNETQLMLASLTI